jgi:hypothetical protein
VLFTVWASVPGRWICVITRQDRLDVDGFSLSGLLSGVVTLSWVIPSLAVAARLP